MHAVDARRHHLSNDELRAFLSERGVPELEEKINQHLEEHKCHWCCGRLEALTRDEPDLSPDPAALTERYELPLRVEWKEGGQGRVCRATHVQLKQEVALKVLHADDVPAVEALHREGETAARLHHPNIVPVYDLIDWDGRPCLVLGYMPNGTLADRIAAGPFPRHEAARVIADLAGAVHYAHTRSPSGILHRDLKPANVLLDEHGTVRLTDFGLASNRNAVGGSTTAREGTPNYMAPEQAAGRVDQIDVRTDVYGLAAILFTLLTGSPPHKGANREAVRQAVSGRGTPALPRSIPADLAAICAKGLAANPDDRYESAAALANDLRRFLADEPVAARPALAIRRLAMWTRRNRGTAAGIAAGIALTVIAVGILITWTVRERAFHRRETALVDSASGTLGATLVFAERDRAAPTDRMALLDQTDQLLSNLRQTDANGPGVRRLEWAARWRRACLAEEVGDNTAALDRFRTLAEAPPVEADGAVRGLLARLKAAAALRRLQKVEEADRNLLQVLETIGPVLVAAPATDAARLFSNAAEVVRDGTHDHRHAGRPQSALALSERLLSLPDRPALVDFAAATLRVSLLVEQASIKFDLQRDDPGWGQDLDGAVRLAEAWFERRPGDRDAATLLWRSCAHASHRLSQIKEARASEYHQRAVEVSPQADRKPWPAEVFMVGLSGFERAARGASNASVDEVVRLTFQLEARMAEAPTPDGVALLLSCFYLLGVAAETSGDQMSADVWGRKFVQTKASPPGGVRPAYAELLERAETAKAELREQSRKIIDKMMGTVANGKAQGKDEVTLTLLLRAEMFMIVRETLPEPVFRRQAASLALVCLEAAVLNGFRDSDILAKERFKPLREEPRFQSIVDLLKRLSTPNPSGGAS